MKLGDYSNSDRDMRSHLHLVHGIYIEPSLSLEEMNRCHDTAHEDALNGTDGWTRPMFRHTHEEKQAPLTGLESWEW